jgi:hypothetical protein
MSYQDGSYDPQKFAMGAQMYEITKTLRVVARALALLVCEKNRPKGLELLDEIDRLEGKK